MIRKLRKNDSIEQAESSRLHGRLRRTWKPSPSEPETQPLAECSRQESCCACRQSVAGLVWGLKRNEPLPFPRLKIAVLRDVHLRMAIGESIAFGPFAI